MAKTLIRLDNVSKIYRQGEIITKALDQVSLDIYEGEILVVLGASGSGKTTFLNVISGLDVVSSGKIYFSDQEITRYGDAKMTRFRKQHVGFIFQTYNLLAHLNVYENVQVGAQLGGHKKEDIHRIIEIVGLQDHEKKQMHQLSGGQQQRVSIARALAKKPLILFGDEPTGALDEVTGKVVLNSLVEANEKLKTTMVIITHNPGIALIGDRIIKMNSGRVVDVAPNQNKTRPDDIPWG